MSTDPPGRFDFEWRRPKALIYRVAVPGWRVERNQYGTTMNVKPVTIGVAFVFGRRCLSLVWGRPKWVRT